MGLAYTNRINVPSTRHIQAPLHGTHFKIQG